MAELPIGSRKLIGSAVSPGLSEVAAFWSSGKSIDIGIGPREPQVFFVEGSSNFRFGNQGASNYWGFNWPEPTFFYSRRIGRSPQGSVPDSTYSEVPLGTSILGAAKLTGKPAAGWNLGALSAITGKETADLAGDFNTAPVTTEVEPLTYYGVARGQVAVVYEQSVVVGAGVITDVAGMHHLGSPR